jgi:plastocyanin
MIAAASAAIASGGRDTGGHIIRRPLTRLLPLLAAAALALTGCGEEGETPERSITVDPGGSPIVTATEYRFDPVQLIIRGRSGDQRSFITIRLENEGSLAHNLKIFDGKRQLAGTRTTSGKGTKATTAVTLDTGRTYRYVCTVGDHERLGMVGKLIVK